MKTHPGHHPGDELLAAYAAGSLPEAPSLIVAAHLALCPDCRVAVRRLEAVGGALLEEEPPVPVGAGLLAGVLARIDAPTTARPAAASATTPDPTGMEGPRAGGRPPVLPQPLRGYVGADLDGIAWTRLMPGVSEATVPCGPGGKVRLLRIKGGMAMPRHTHGGSELTMVLAGGFTDEHGHYLRGDFSATDGSVDHMPVSDEGEDCVCITVTDAPLRLTGTLGRLLNPFIRF